jgi:hypothetical protein
VASGVSGTSSSHARRNNAIFAATLTSSESAPIVSSKAGIMKVSLSADVRAHHRCNSIGP